MERLLQSHISSRRRFPAGRRGFTLLEILLALALVGMLMVALNTFIFSMGEHWGRHSDVRLFEQHVRNVSRFLQNELRVAAFPPSGRLSDAGVAPKEIRDSKGITDSLLTFELPQETRLVTWPGRALPDVVCSLVVRSGEGLVLLWQSRDEKKYGDDPPREAAITPLVTAMAYDYYDADFKKWKTDPTLKKDSNGKVMSPQRIRLTFTYGKLTRESVIALPTLTEGIPQI